MESITLFAYCFHSRVPPTHCENTLTGLKKKYLLKKSQTSRLPASTLSRRKAGFNAPLAHWMDRESGGLFQDLDVRSLSGELFQETAVRRLCDDHWSGRRDNHLKLFALIALHHWQNEILLQAHQVNKQSLSAFRFPGLKSRWIGVQNGFPKYRQSTDPAWHSRHVRL